VNALKKVSQFEFVPLPEVLAKARPIEDAEPAAETDAAPQEPAKPPKRTQNGLPEK
jgi:hypothetical protein